MIIKACANCGKERQLCPSQVQRFKYCSKECHDAAQTGERKNITCQQCGNYFKAKKDHGKWQKFCSIACRDHGNKKPEWKECATCETKFLAKSSSHKTEDGLKIYCSKKCAGEGLRRGEERNCLSCGKVFYLSPVTVKRKRSECCSNECRTEFYAAGLSRSWKGGRYINADGAVFVYVDRSGSAKEYIQEHRLVASRVIGRVLHPQEFVIHLNKIKSDNRPENLFVCTNSEFSKIRQGGAAYPRESNLQTYK